MTGSGKTALVTGASSGIGRACALALAGMGYQIGVGYRADHEGARRTAAAAGPSAVLVQLDLANPERAADAVDRFASRGHFDVLVNNAGVNRRADAVEETLVNWRRILDARMAPPSERWDMR